LAGISIVLSVSLPVARTSFGQTTTVKGRPATVGANGTADQARGYSRVGTPNKSIQKSPKPKLSIKTFESTESSESSESVGDGGSKKIDVGGKNRQSVVSKTEKATKKVSRKAPKKTSKKTSNKIKKNEKSWDYYGVGIGYSMFDSFSYYLPAFDSGDSARDSGFIPGRPGVQNPFYLNLKVARFDKSGGSSNGPLWGEAFKVSVSGLSSDYGISNAPYQGSVVSGGENYIEAVTKTSVQKRTFSLAYSKEITYTKGSDFGLPGQAFIGLGLQSSLIVLNFDSLLVTKNNAFKSMAHSDRYGLLLSGFSSVGRRVKIFDNWSVSMAAEISPAIKYVDLYKVSNNTGYADGSSDNGYSEISKAIRLKSEPTSMTITLGIEHSMK
jgi:hypothetical protein